MSTFLDKFNIVNSEIDLLSINKIEPDRGDIKTYHKVEHFEIGRPDLIALKHYNNPKLYWIILKLNGINYGFTQRKSFKVDYSEFEYEKNYSEVYLGRMLVILKLEAIEKYMRN